MHLDFTRDECLNLERALRYEWLETDGLGGYAASSILDCHTRKYHGLLVSPLPALNGKFVLLSKLEASLVVEGKTFRLSTNKYPGVFDPTGHQYIERFSYELHPTTLYRVGDIQFKRSLMLVRGEPTVLVKFDLLAAELPVKLHLQPLLAYRNIHALTRSNLDLHVKTFVEKDYYKIEPYAGMPPLYLDMSAPSQFHAGPMWLQNIEYLKERSRGFDYQEDLFCPGIVELDLQAGDTIVFRASLCVPARPTPKQWATEHARRTRIWKKFRDKARPIRVLKTRAAEQLVITDCRNQVGVVAGYPWFGQYGRDTMISVPGLALARQDRGLALDLLTAFASHERHGLLPNFLPEGPNEEIPYNSVDASLWFFWAAQEYFAATGDTRGVRAKLLPVMARVLTAFIDGRTPHVKLLANGLIAAGSEYTNLTWMDAQVHGRPVTPRHGCAVELNALWYNALCFYRDLSARLRSPCAELYHQLPEKCQAAFVETFWREDLQYLADVVNEHGQDTAIRPNQIFAASLPYSPLTTAQRRAVVACVEKNLVTPYGLRSLSPGHPAYCAQYHGGPAERDRAYHQGTVWAWLVGHYVQAALALADKPAARRAELKALFAPLFNGDFEAGCVGSVPEIFNADPPYTPKGCFSQAWSVAEVIRAWEMLKRKVGRQ